MGLAAPEVIVLKVSLVRKPVDNRPCGGRRAVECHRIVDGKLEVGTGPVIVDRAELRFIINLLAVHVIHLDEGR